MDEPDRSNGYEGVAEAYIAGRGSGGIVGVAAVRQWAQTLPPGSSVLDLGCGNGVPISRVLMENGLSVWGVDASAKMVAAFRARFPAAPVECSPVEESALFGRAFDAVMAWGLMFLLAPATQELVIRKAAGVLGSGGRFLFTSPPVVCEWADAMTGQTSVSLGAERYIQLLEEAGLTVVGQWEDEGQNHYYLSVKGS
jgi:2-polyprenyl-3-methyl-5-hydroxy-6-metoxy-1,4-benzoquinol methylase